METLMFLVKRKLIIALFDDLVDAQYTFTGQPITFGRGRDG